MTFTTIAMRLALAVPVVRMWSLATESINDFKHDYIAATSHFHNRNLKMKKSSLSYLEGALNVLKGFISPNL